MSFSDYNSKQPQKLISSANNNFSSLASFVNQNAGTISDDNNNSNNTDKTDLLIEKCLADYKALQTAYLISKNNLAQGHQINNNNLQIASNILKLTNNPTISNLKLIDDYTKDLKNLQLIIQNETNNLSNININQLQLAHNNVNSRNVAVSTANSTALGIKTNLLFTQQELLQEKLLRLCSFKNEYEKIIALIQKASSISSNFGVSGDFNNKVENNNLNRNHYQQNITPENMNINSNSIHNNLLTTATASALNNLNEQKELESQIKLKILQQQSGVSLQKISKLMASEQNMSAMDGQQQLFHHQNSKPGLKNSSSTSDLLYNMLGTGDQPAQLSNQDLINAMNFSNLSNLVNHTQTQNQPPATAQSLQTLQRAMKKLSKQNRTLLQNQNFNNLQNTINANSNKNLFTIGAPIDNHNNNSFASKVNFGADGDYTLKQNEILSSPNAYYTVKEWLGRGTFGQVVMCHRKAKGSGSGGKSSNGQQWPQTKSYERVAVKILKNQPSYARQGQVEINILQTLSTTDADQYNFVTAYECFTHYDHQCLVFEMLDLNLYEFLRNDKFAPLPLSSIRPILQQVLTALDKLQSLGLIHADLKPENIMLVNPGKWPFRVKVIDFGSATYTKHVNNLTSTYLQSRYYRAPEILLGLPFDNSIDIWSLGCVAAELYLGWPLYPGASEYDQLRYIIETHGLPDYETLNKATKIVKFFNKDLNLNNFKNNLVANNNKYIYTFKTAEQYVKETGQQSKETRKYKFSRFDDLLLLSKERAISSEIQNRPDFTNNNIERQAEETDTLEFISLLKKLLFLDMKGRIQPSQALSHNFITLGHFRSGTTNLRETATVRYSAEVMDRAIYTFHTNSDKNKSENYDDFPERTSNPSEYYFKNRKRKNIYLDLLKPDSLIVNEQNTGTKVPLQILYDRNSRKVIKKVSKLKIFFSFKFNFSFPKDQTSTENYSKILNFWK